MSVALWESCAAWAVRAVWCRWTCIRDNDLMHGEWCARTNEPFRSPWLCASPQPHCTLSCAAGCTRDRGSVTQPARIGSPDARSDLLSRLGCRPSAAPSGPRACGGFVPQRPGLAPRHTAHRRHACSNHAPGHQPCTILSSWLMHLSCTRAPWHTRRDATLVTRTGTLLTGRPALNPRWRAPRHELLTCNLKHVANVYR